MFCQSCESPAAVYNIENGQANRSAMPHFGETAYVIKMSPHVPGK